MAMRNITNLPPKFRLHVDLEREYATVRSMQVSKNIQPNQLRMQGSKAIDLWTDGTLYPTDPFTNAAPPFCNLTGLLRFVGDGFSGLLGYCRRLHELYLEEAGRGRHIQNILEQFQVSAAQKMKSLTEKVNLLEQELQDRKNQIAERVQTIHQVADNYMLLRNSTRNLRRRVDHFTHLPIGFNARKRKRTAIGLLSKQGGARKRRVQATKKCAEAILHCQGEEQTVQASLLNHVINEKDIIAMISNPLNSKLREKLHKIFLHGVERIMTPKDMLHVCDAAGISQKGYGALYKCITLGLRTQGFERSLLPTPYSVHMAKKATEFQIGSMFGGFKCVEGSMPLSAGNSFHYSKYNNVYIDMEALQRAMVQYYDLSLEETAGKVVFVLKLDECQVVKNQKLERVSLTLMSRALKGKALDNEEGQSLSNEDGNSGQSKKDYFGVQSEKNIWWQSAWVLPHENHESLRWYFNKAGICDIVARQTNGQHLEVAGVGSFEVEWHLGGDLKTLKCMLGTKLGANTIFPCIYCCHTKTPVGVVKKGRKSNQEKGKKTAGPCVGHQKNGSMQWSNGVLSCSQSLPPNRDTEDPNWNPILNIPLSRVHVCSLHARLRILDKLLKLHVNYAWNMEPANRREDSIHALESILSSIGLHAGAVTLTKDQKNPNTTQDNPNKICMGGAKARHLLSNNTSSKSHTEFQIWKKVCDVTTFRGNGANLGLKRARVWESCDTMLHLLEKSQLSDHEVDEFRQSLRKFTEQMVDAWGETHITHYMHILYAHAPYFIDTYGSLALWSNQGMEKSHYQAKAAYFKNTRHGGGKVKSNALHEMFNWFYRVLTGIKVNKSFNVSLKRRTTKVVSARRTQGYLRSNARLRIRQWIANRQRCGSVWAKPTA